MAQSKREIIELLSRSGAKPRHQFGQNFMIDQNLVRAVAEAGALGPDDCVIEVGPGTGTLTEELLERAGRVVAVEIDRALAETLRQRFGNRPNFLLIEGDALAGKHELSALLAAALRDARGGARDPVGEVSAPPSTIPDEDEGTPTRLLPRSTSEGDQITPPEGQRPPESGFRLKLVANLPYNIASPLVIELLSEGVELLAFTVQKEVADRLRASPGSREYGPLTVIAQLLSRVEVLRTLPPQAFWPMPKVESALVRLPRDDRLGPRARPFNRFVQSLFSFRRKMLRRALAQAGYDPEPLLQAAEMDGQLRAEQFAPESLLRLFEAATREHR